MHKDGTPDEFDRDREDWEDRQQLAKQALDLRAVERDLKTRKFIVRASAEPTIAALLVHCRTLRAAVKECRDILAHANLANRVLWLDSVLAQATDE